jgi:hypothetical protein
MEKKTFLNYMLRASLLLTSLCFAIPSPVIFAQGFQRSDIVFETSFENENALADWSGSANLAEGFKSGHSLFVERPAESPMGITIVEKSLPAEKLRGYTLAFDAMVKAENVTKAPEAWNGVKFQVHCMGPSGETWGSAAGPRRLDGTFDWKPFEFVKEIPPDATEVTLCLGFQNSTGKAWFDNVRVRIFRTPLPKRPLQAVTGPVDKGHELERLRGVMAPVLNFEKSLQVLGQEWNANLIRWPLVPESGNMVNDPDNPQDMAAYDAWLEKRMTQLDQVMSLCEKYGLRIAVSLHKLPGGREGYFTRCQFLEKKKFQDKLVETWEKLARRCNGRKAVWGYDLANEPYQGAMGEPGTLDWTGLATRIAKAIRAIDSTTAIIVESEKGGTPEGFRWMEPIPVPHVVYSFHMYAPGQFTHQGVPGFFPLGVPYPGLVGNIRWDKEQLRREMQPAIDFQKTYGAHMFVGEFSAIRWAPDHSAFRYIRDCIELFEEYGWDWTYHAFRGYEGWDVEYGDDINDKTPSKVQTDREKLLREWFAKNKKPQMSGKREAACPTISAQVMESSPQYWQPQSGSQPVRMEKLPDGSACLAFDVKFSKEGETAVWDWISPDPLDLSSMGHIQFDVSSTNGDLAGHVTLIFAEDGDGAPLYSFQFNGIYSTFFNGVTEEWSTRIVSPFAPLSVQKKLGMPDWGKIRRVSLHVVGSGAGKGTFRLRKVSFLPKDPSENLLKNGSFEISGNGLPYAWGGGHWGVFELPWFTNMDRWRRNWCLDTTTAKDGKTSLLLENEPGLPLLKVVSTWLIQQWQKEINPSHYVFSVWMKSDQDKLPVSFGPDVTLKVPLAPETTFQVGRQWEQFQLKVATGPGMRITIAPKAPGKLWIDAAQLQNLGKATAEFHPHAEDEFVAAREKAVDWSFPRRISQIAEGRSITGPVKKATVAVDSHRRFLVNGQPYLPFALGFSNLAEHNLELLNFAARSGFKNVVIQVWPYTSKAQKKILDRCAEAGLRAIVWYYKNIPREQLVKFIREFKDHPALLCWYVFDEPLDEKAFAEAEERLKLAKEIDPSHPAYINYYENHLADQKGDIYSTDTYPIPWSSPRWAIRCVEQMNRAAEKENKPVWMWLQGTGHAYFCDRDPTPREVSCMVYGSLIRGARGIMWFIDIPFSKSCFEEMRALCVETETLTPVLSSLDQAPEVHCDRPEILCKAFSYQREVWVLAVNTCQTTCRARLSLSFPGQKTEVVFEDRQILLERDSWTDLFGPYERHVYRLDTEGYKREDSGRE